MRARFRLAWPSLFAAGALAALPAVSAAQGPAYQVADIAPNTPAQRQGGIGYPSGFQPVAGGDVFLARAGTGPASIWRTDGTPAGTKPVVAGATLGVGGLVGSNGERAYFAGGTTSRTSAVWATDGTANGTVLLRGGLADGGIFSSSPDVAVADGRLFFHDCHAAPSQGCDLWTSAGTPETTRKIAALSGLVSGVTGSAGTYYFFASPADDFRPALWRSDGSAEGTVILRVFDTYGLMRAASVDGRAVLVAEQQLWVTNGTTLELVRALGSGEFIHLFDAIVVGAEVYFRSEPSNGGTTLTVWRSDGTVGGTHPVLSTSVGSSTPTAPRRWVQQLGGRIYYLVPGPQGRDPYTLWWSSAGGAAQPLACVVCSSVASGLLSFGGRLLFTAVSNGVPSLWVLDGTHVPRPVSACDTGCRVGSMVTANGRVFFVVDYSELWVTDATAGGTMKLDSFDTVYELYASESLDAVLFGASREFFVRENLWVSQGTVQSTIALTAVEGAGSEPRQLRRAGSRVAFVACGDEEERGLWGAGAHDAGLIKEGYVDCLGSSDGFDPFVSTRGQAFFQIRESSGYEELWATEGTAASTRKLLEGVGEIAEIVPSGAGAVIWTTRIVAAARETTLWRSDGTSDGTARLFDLPAGTWSPSSTIDIGGELYFRTGSPSSQIWRTDGTAAGLRRLTDAPPGELVYDVELTRVGAFVYFAGTSGIWRTNGTAAGTSLVVPAPEGGSVSWFHEQGGALLYSRTEHGVSTLWRTQGTPGSTQQVAALDTAVPLYYRSPPTVTSFGGLLYFAADDGSRGVELWRTDGTSAGTVMVRDIGVSSVSGNPRDLVVFDGRLFFTADDTFTGSELWVSDGTSARTHVVQDIAPLAASSTPRELTVVGDLLYFSADDGVTGRELWALPLASQEPCTPDEERLCLQGDRFRLEVTWRDFAARTGSGHAVPLTGDTGYFWFFDAANVELAVKVLDGTGLNGHHWVFYGALSSVEYTLTVTDTYTGEVKRYVNPSGTFASVGDTSAFPRSAALSASAARPKRLGSAGVHSLNVVPPAPCQPTNSRLCLQGGRFAVDAVWQDFAGHTDGGTAVTLTGDTGYFWFFGASNVEVVLKVLDGRPLNGKFWVFYGALSNVEYTLTVTDTVTGAQREYHNPSGRFASAGDTSAF